MYVRLWLTLHTLTAACERATDCLFVKKRARFTLGEGDRRSGTFCPSCTHLPLAVFLASLHLLMPPHTSSIWGESSERRLSVVNCLRRMRLIIYYYFFLFVSEQHSAFFWCLALIRSIKRGKSKLLWTSGCVKGCEGGLVKALIMDYIRL